MATENNDNQSFPDTTAEIAAMLNIGDSTSEVNPVDTHTPVPANLPIIEAVGTPVHPTEHELKATDPANFEEDLEDLEEASRPLNENIKDSKARVFRIAKSAAPYLAIFVVGLFMYQYFFSGFSVAQFLKNDQSKVVESQSETNARLDALKVSQAGSYDAWIHQFFYEVTDPAIIDMDNDLSGNGLTNFEKFLLNLNPKAYDTLGLGQPDGQTVMDGINPWTGKSMSDNQKKIVELYFDRQIISNRLAAGSLKLSQGGIANANFAPGNGGYQNPSNYSFVDGTGNTGGAQVAGAYTNQPQQILGTGTGGGGGADSLHSLDINQSIPGQLNIPANKISAPVIFTQDTKNFNTDLTKGVVHYPGTALPGEIGTAYISGHSSGYAWQKNAYKNIFRGLGNVEDGTSFTITVTLRDGRKATINYVVRSRQEFAANDQAQFVQTSEPRVALSTCWPADTSKLRLVVFADQTQISY